ncbi:hypothetical protein ASG90_13610 [Nocardioides sp. Soil797]|nr:hypothetical protein ASD30_08690 [Nocardioides sp. Root140]KRF13854.1 hypothetical protein ASG90_13610 [Nocardioides sp. Soil797]
MSDALKTLLPLFAFMLIPVWIPMIAAAVGCAFDAVGRVRGRGRPTTRIAASGQHKAVPVT